MDALSLRAGKNPLFLIQQEVPKAKTPMEKLPENLNHIWIADVSGSMYGTLPQLAQDMIAKMNDLPDGDSFSFGWFSGEGDFRFVLKGLMLNAKTREVAAKTIKENLRARNTTCFSEILFDTEQVLKDLEAYGFDYALCFFTDGYPVVSNYARELSNITQAISRIAGKIASTLLVGYGSYYNKQLMAEMAEKFGGSLIHSEDLPSFNIQLANFLHDCREVGQRVKVKLETHNPMYDFAFSINGNQVCIYQPDSQNEILFTPHKRNKDYVYALSKTCPSGVDAIQLTDAKVKASTPIVKGAYAVALILTQQTKTNIALEILGALGDVNLINKVNTSFTNAEYGRTEAEILEAVVSPSKRLKAGRDSMYLPPADAFCLLDVLGILQEDDAAMFYPQHPDFDYKRISRKQTDREGYPKFVPDPKAGSPFIDMVWNDTKLNLSVRVKTPGTIQLNAGHQQLGFAEMYPTYVWRNYSLVKDGFLNVDRLPLTLSRKTVEILEAKGLKFISGPTASCLVADLTSVPIINRGIAEGKTSANELCKKVYQELLLEAKQKVIGYHISQLETRVPKSISPAMLSGAQQIFLNQHGINLKDGSFDPPADREPATDFYMAKEFEIKIQGLSKLPKVADSFAKTGKLTKGDELLVAANSQLDNSLDLEYLRKELRVVQKALRELRAEIQKTKFAILLGKQWFDEFCSREDNTLEIAGVKFTISLTEKKVEI